MLSEHSDLKIVSAAVFNFEAVQLYYRLMGLKFKSPLCDLRYFMKFPYAYFDFTAPKDFLGWKMYKGWLLVLGFDWELNYLVSGVFFAQLVHILSHAIIDFPSIIRNL